MDGSMFREFLASHRLGELLKETFKPFPCSGDRVRWDYLSEEKKDILIHWGEDALLGYPQLTATQFLAYSRTGERGVFETPYFSRRKLVFGAALAECVENKGRFVDAVIDGIWLICEETSWVVSAHNNQEPDDMYPFQHKSLPDENNPYVDLFAAQTASVLSYVLYFMKEKLDAEGWKTFQQFTKAQMEASSLSDCDSFISGFRLGAKMIMDVLLTPSVLK